MHFAIIAKDAQDAQALERRMSARQAHVKNIDSSLNNILVGAATLDDAGTMNGSVLIVDFPSRSDLDAWLAAEPYVTAGVWQDITVIPCKLGPSFENKF